jgi:hypothetical protein
VKTVAASLKKLRKKLAASLLRVSKKPVKIAVPKSMVVTQEK